MNQVQHVHACFQDKTGPELRLSRGLAKRSVRKDYGCLPVFTSKTLSETGTMLVHGITNYEKGGPSASD